MLVKLWVLKILCGLLVLYSIELTLFALAFYITAFIYFNKSQISNQICSPQINFTRQ